MSVDIVGWYCFYEHSAIIVHWLIAAPEESGRGLGDMVDVRHNFDYVRPLGGFVSRTTLLKRISFDTFLTYRKDLENVTLRAFRSVLVSVKQYFKHLAQFFVGEDFNFYQKLTPCQSVDIDARKWLKCPLFKCFVTLFKNNSSLCLEGPFKFEKRHLVHFSARYRFRENKLEGLSFNTRWWSRYFCRLPSVWIEMAIFTRGRRCFLPTRQKRLLARSREGVRLTRHATKPFAHTLTLYERMVQKKPWRGLSIINDLPWVANHTTPAYYEGKLQALSLQPPWGAHCWEDLTIRPNKNVHHFLLITNYKKIPVRFKCNRNYVLIVDQMLQFFT